MTPYPFEAKRQEAEAKKVKRRAKTKLLYGKDKAKIYSRTELEKGRWEAFSRYVRKWAIKEGLKCWGCDTGPIESVNHIISRSKRAIRYDPRNVYAGCVACNGKEHFSTVGHDFFINKFQKKYGIEAWNQLYADQDKECKESKQKIIEDIIEYNKLYEEILTK